MATLTHEPPCSTDTVPWLIRLYPRTWRDRYSAEFVDLLAARPPSRRDRLDIVRGALDARLHPQLDDSPAPRIATAGDRLLALAGVTVGILFGLWGGLLAVAAPRWGSMQVVDEEIAAIAFTAGFVGLVVAVGVLVGLAHRHLDELGPTGAFAAIVAAVGFLFTVGGASAVGILVVTGATLVLAPSLSRVVPTAIAAMLAGATAFLALGMFGFIGSGGQDVFWLFMLIAYGPTWALLGFNLRHGRPAAPVVAAAA